MQLQDKSIFLLEKISNLCENDIVAESKDLKDNVTNLEKVAQYCEDIYVNSKDLNKHYLLNETQSYTTQALGSVAYQIHVLANSFLDLLNSQSALIDDMGISISHLAHEVNLHKEKVARREIGSITANKCIERTSKVKKPEIEEKPIKYVRKPIDYSLLDDVGHGVKLSQESYNLESLAKLGVNKRNSLTSTNSSASTNTSIATSGISTPPLVLKSSTIMNSSSSNGHNTIRASSIVGSSIYRVPVAPPSIPSEYLSRQELGIYSSIKELNQSIGSETGLYASTNGIRRPSQLSNNKNFTNTNSVVIPEYSSVNPIDKKMNNQCAYQLNSSFNSTDGSEFGKLNNNLNLSLNSSIGTSSCKEISMGKTNYNRIDYSFN